MTDQQHDVIIIGGGQAGLAIGRLLARAGREITILDAADTPAAAWRARWDSLKPVHPGALRQPAGAHVPRRPRRLPRP
jgi:putative flavoprotein involved in K+ transport